MVTVQVLEDREALARAVAHRISTRVAELQETQARRPRLVLTGGSVAGEIYGLLTGDALMWHEVDYYWGDERYVESSSSDRNELQAREAFLDRFEVPEERIHAMPAAGRYASKEEAAESYAADLPDEFDLVLLGVGPDGHIASLFPGFEQLAVLDRDVVAVDDSPKPPPERLSLTFAALNRTTALWFVVAGEDKAQAVAAALAGSPVEEVPAAGARGIEETLWLLDTEAAGRLPR
ncbi:6-phosphogluconolactonase [Aeromicrobium sp. YIM 150415]|uniref:6-phosphogluconolactonase n=1 Tax=Aeromicrobium sp. YIM 150415 TaxID=2803912 RepID=UPI00196471DE|nr:6-phosphogluconolactonase [Aeromicrobium sp. YIM 150415]MBM9462612.1 6-phosphogluconolactonase [Aeromicrobium sp. YIM 150415]